MDFMGEDWQNLKAPILRVQVSWWEARHRKFHDAVLHFSAAGRTFTDFEIGYMNA